MRSPRSSRASMRSRACCWSIRAPRQGHARQLPGLAVLASRTGCTCTKPNWRPSGPAFLEESDPTVRTLRQVGRFSHVHLGFFDGEFVPTEQDEAAGPDSFEVGIGNFLVYSVSLWERGGQSDAPERDQGASGCRTTMRDCGAQRLEAVRWFCLNNLRHIPLYVERGLYFQSFDRLYNAYQEFLQALFIVTPDVSRSRTTSGSVSRSWRSWACLSCTSSLPRLLEIGDLESTELVGKAEDPRAPAGRVRTRTPTSGALNQSRPGRRLAEPGGQICSFDRRKQLGVHAGCGRTSIGLAGIDRWSSSGSLFRSYSSK